MKKTLKTTLHIVLILFIVGSVAFVGWASFPLGPGPAALASLESGTTITVATTPDWIVMQPSNQQVTSGFIFYPGGRVDYRSYAHLLKPLAAQGYLVVLARMPLSLAVFSPAKAEAVIQAFSGINQWVIGGHSLGGAMAANYVYNNPGKLDGLVLWASFPATSNSLADHDIKVMSIYGSEDGEVEAIEDSRNLLPADTTWVRIEGGNHAQFGDYGTQPGDGEAMINAQAQWEQVINATADFMSSIANR